MRKVHYPYHDRAWDAKAEFEKVKPQGTAKLLTYTAIFQPAVGFRTSATSSSGGEFENKVKAMGQIKADSVDQAKDWHEGETQLGVIRVQYGEDVYGLKFEPAGVISSDEQ